MILATGPLSVPAAFNDAGYLLGTLFLLVIMILSFIAAEFVIETMSICNSIRFKNNYQHFRYSKELNQLLHNINDDHDESTPYLLHRKIEFGEMSFILWGKIGIT